MEQAPVLFVTQAPPPLQIPAPILNPEDDPCPTSRGGYPRRVTVKPKDIYVDANLKSISKVVKQDRKKDLLGEISDWHAELGKDAAYAALYWPVLNERDSFETVQREHARVAAALGVPLDDDGSTGDDSDDSKDRDYHEGASQSDSEKDAGEEEDDSEDEDGSEDEEDSSDDEEDNDCGALCAQATCYICGSVPPQTLAAPYDPFGCPHHCPHRAPDDDDDNLDEDEGDDDNIEGDDNEEDEDGTAQKRCKISEQES